MKRKMKEQIENGGEYADRGQQLVLIGIDMDRARLEEMLDMCLVTDEEFALGPDEWAEYENPFLEAVLGDLLAELEEAEEGEEDGEAGEEDEEDGEEQVEAMDADEQEEEAQPKSRGSKKRSKPTDEE